MGLFSTEHHYHSETKYVPYTKNVNITEKKAPTDESIRLLNEFEEKAKQNLVNSCFVDGNTFKFQVIAFADDIPMDSTTMHLKFTLNAQDFYFKKTYQNRDKISELFYGIGRAKHLSQYCDVSEGLRGLIVEFLAPVLVSKMMESPDFMKTFLSPTKVL